MAAPKTTKIQKASQPVICMYVCVIASQAQTLQHIKYQIIDVRTTNYDDDGEQNKQDFFSKHTVEVNGYFELVTP